LQENSRRFVLTNLEAIMQYARKTGFGAFVFAVFLTMPTQARASDAVEWAGDVLQFV
jgi:hypothetical protein